MNSDITFTLSGTDYQFMLCEDQRGQKLWAVEPKFEQPPSRVENRILMAVKAAKKMRDKDKVIIKDRDIDDVLDDIDTLKAGEDITLSGFDGRTYYVTLDVDSGNAVAIRDKSGRITEYRIDVACWDLAQVS